MEFSSGFLFLLTAPVLVVPETAYEGFAFRGIKLPADTLGSHAPIGSTSTAYLFLINSINFRNRHAERHASYTEAMRCVICQRFLPKTARRGTRFCGTNCRSRAYRMRQTPEEGSTPLSVGIGDSQRLPEATRPRKRAHNPVTIPAVLEHLQQARERVGLPPLLTDPMLAYQANLDALLTERRAVQRILTTHVTDAEQVTRGNTALLKDPKVTQVGVGVALTDRGNSVVVILLGRQVADATTSTHKNTGPLVSMLPTPLGSAPTSDLYSHGFAAARVENIKLGGANPKFWMPPEPIEDPVSLDSRLDDPQLAVTAAIDSSEPNDPKV